MLRYLGTIIIVIACVFITIKVHQLNTHLRSISSIIMDKDTLRLKISEQVESKLSILFSKNDITNSSNTSYLHLLIILSNHPVMQKNVRILSYNNNNYELGIVFKEDTFPILLQSDNQHYIYTVKHIQTSAFFDSIMTEKLADWNFKGQVDN